MINMDKVAIKRPLEEEEWLLMNSSNTLVWKGKKGFGKMLTLLHFPDMQRQEENEQAPFEKFMIEMA